MQKLIPFLAIVIFACGCQKEKLTLTPTVSSELKIVDASKYNQVRNAIAKGSEFETYNSTDYFYTESIIINGVAWEYPTSGYEYLMYKGLTHFADASNNFFYCGLEWPADGYQYGIGFGTKMASPGYFPFTANVTVSFPEKNYTVIYNDAPCFAIGDESLANTDSITIILHKKQKKNLVVVADSVLSFAQLKDKLGLGISAPDSVALYSSLGKVESFDAANIYNWIYYGSSTSDIYGLEDAGVFTENLNFGDGLIGSNSGGIDIYLHKNNIVYKCTTSYSIFYVNYIGSKKQLHIYE